MSYRDVVCVTSLLNRLKTIQLQKEVEILSLEDLPQDEKFAAVAAQRILQNDEMYSLYKKYMTQRAVDRAEYTSLYSKETVQYIC